VEETGDVHEPSGHKTYSFTAFDEQGCKYFGSGLYSHADRQVLPQFFITRFPPNDYEPHYYTSVLFDGLIIYDFDD
jgi:hypothetical protein